MGDERLAELGQQLSAVAEELGDLALERLRSAAADGGGEAAEQALADERRLVRARRAVEKAAMLLAGGDGD